MTDLPPEKCEWGDCARPTTGHSFGSMAWSFYCEGHERLAVSNRDSHSYPHLAHEARDQWFKEWAEERRSAFQWLRDNPNPTEAHHD